MYTVYGIAFLRFTAKIFRNNFPAKKISAKFFREFFLSDFSPAIFSANFFREFFGAFFRVFFPNIENKKLQKLKFIGKIIGHIWSYLVKSARANDVGNFSTVLKLPEELLLTTRQRHTHDHYRGAQRVPLRWRTQNFSVFKIFDFSFCRGRSARVIPCFAVHTLIFANLVNPEIRKITTSYERAMYV